MRHINILIILITALIPCVCHAQQQSNWDTALDRYELICERCLELMHNQQAGQSIPIESISSLKTQLTMLRNSLLQVQGQMTAAQKARFDMIRQRFGEDIPENATVVSSPAVTAKQQQKKQETAPVEAEKAEKNNPKFLIPSNGLVLTDDIPLADRGTTPSIHFEKRRDGILQEITVPDSNNEYLIGIQAAVQPIQSYGVMFGMLFKSERNIRFGAYIKGLSDLKFEKVSAGYSCDSKGILPDGQKVWTNGKTFGRRFSFNAGGLARIGSHLGFYLGAGYGSTRYFIKDINGICVNINDTSVAGISLETGVLTFVRNHLFAGVGISTTAFLYTEAQISIGINL